MMFPNFIKWVFIMCWNGETKVVNSKAFDGIKIEAILCQTAYWSFLSLIFLSLFYYWIDLKSAIY